MKTASRSHLKQAGQLWLALVACMTFAMNTREGCAQANSWTNLSPAGGYWDDTNNWSLGVAPASNQTGIFITNAISKVVLIDSLAATTPAVMTVSNLTLAGVGASTNTLDVATAGSTTPLRIRNGLVIGSNGALVINNSTMAVDGLSGGPLQVEGDVTVQSGAFVTTNVNSVIGYNGSGRVTLSSGMWQARTVSLATRDGSVGNLTIAGGTNSISGDLKVADDKGGTASVVVTGGHLLVTNATAYATIGQSGVGQLTLSNGTVTARTVVVGNSPGAQGTLTVNGGVFKAGGGYGFVIANTAGATGTVVVTGGVLDMRSGGNVGVGAGGAGSFTVSGGTYYGGAVDIGVLAGATGMWTITGGTNHVNGYLVIGETPCTSMGQVQVSGGELLVTNATHTAELDVRSGTLTQSDGVLAVDRLIITNACGHFIRTGGAFAYDTLVLNLSLDADGDGMSNQFELDYGLDPFSPADANVDNDGDGFTNLQEALAGTDPTSGTSAFRILAITCEGNDIRVTWLGGGGRTNVVAASSGHVTNTPQEVSPPIILPGSTPVTTNWLDAGGATNSPVRFYEIRLSP